MSDDSDVEERLRRLEETVDELRREVEQLREEFDSEVDADAEEGPPTGARPETSRSRGPEGVIGDSEGIGEPPSGAGTSANSSGGSDPGRVASTERQTSESETNASENSTEDGEGQPAEGASSESVGTQILNYVGIGLLFLGVVFLFDYAIEQGWLTEWVRVAIGALLGSGLLAGGLWIREDRSALGGVLTGGGTATYYATVFGAFQLYELMPFAVAFALMVGVTMLAFLLALSFDSVGLALVGMIGGYATPFLLTTGSSDVVGLVAYTSVVTAGTAAIYLLRGWTSVLAAELAGHWLVMTVATTVGESSGGGAFEGVVFYLAVAVGWGVTGGLPILRAMLLGESADEDDTEEWLGTMRWLTARVAVVVTPLYGFAIVQEYAEFSESSLGLASVALAVVYAGIHVVLRRRQLREYASTLLWVAIFGVTFGLIELLEGQALELGLAAVTFAAIWLGRRYSERVLRIGAGVVGALAVVDAGWLLMEEVSPVEFGGHVVALGLLFSASRQFRSEFARVTGGVLVYVLVLHLLGSGLSQLPNGEAWVTASWAVFGFVLVGWGAHAERQFDHSCGLLVVAVVVGKLFFVDLAEVDALWRIFLFLGVGGLFLAVSYLFPEIVSPETADGRGSGKADNE